MEYRHPLVILVYYICVISLAMLINNPICTLFSIIGAGMLVIRIKGTDNILKSIIYLIIMVVITAAINPMFSHEGMTTLTYLPGGNPLTLESILFGINMAAILLAVVLWFITVNKIMTSERIMYVIGRIFPVLALTFSMSLRFIPRLTTHMKEVRNVNRVLTGTPSGISSRLHEAVSVMSSTFTWILDDSVNTADSMRCRGFGLPGRTSYTRYIFRAADGIWLVIITVMTIYVIWGYATDYIYWQYYPYVLCEYHGFISISVYTVYMMLCFIPAIIWERRGRFNGYQQDINE